MSNAVTVKEITKKYSLYKDPWGPIKEVFMKEKLHKEFFALRGVTLDFPKGESIGILGKNGSGKSTLLKIITGITEPTTGEVQVNGSIVFLDVSSGIDSELSGYDNIFMKGTLLGYSKEEMLEKVDDIIEFSELGDFIGQPVKNYSSGMKSKLGFAISVNVDPDILIVDEALAVGDSVFRKKCMNKMNEFKLQGKTIIFVSHDNHAVESFCSKAAWIHQGELITYGDSTFVSSLYDDFMSGRKSIESIHAQIEFKHAIEHVSYYTSEKGYAVKLDGFIRDQAGADIHTQCELVVTDKRTGEVATKAFGNGTSGFSIELTEAEFPLFFKPGTFSFSARIANADGELAEFALWAGQPVITQLSSTGKHRYQYEFSHKQHALELAIRNIEKTEQQVNRIWVDQQVAHINGVAFVRGYETKTANAVSMTLYLTNLTTFERIAIPATISETEEITENPKYNPQGKVYNFSEFTVAVDLESLPVGNYESHLSYHMNNEPHHELLHLVWASKPSHYPTEALSTDSGIVEIKTVNKYLQLTKQIHQ